MRSVLGGITDPGLTSRLVPRVLRQFHIMIWRPQLLIPTLWAVKPGGGEPLVVVDGNSSDSASDGADGAGQKAEGANPQQLHDLMVEHADAVYRLALGVVRDPALAEDVAQDTMVKAWLALPTFRGDGSLRGWLLRIAHNTAISTLRTRRAIVIDPFDMPEETGPPERTVERKVEGSHTIEAFEGALDLLDDLSRSIVVLRELEGLSYEEISDLLKVPLPTVKTRLLRARRRLSTALEEWA